MSQTDVNITANRKMAAEKARVAVKKKKRLTRLELAAMEWKKERERKERRVEDKRHKTGSDRPEFPLPLRKTNSGALAKECAEPAHAAMEPVFDWQSFSSGNGKNKNNNGSLNSATIHAFAKRIMAREWARALGRRRRDPRAERFEMEALRLMKGGELQNARR